ncbi:hypothetical protein FQA39_LY17343 [Lamprigera yunnana]|nr:hypothetical protein FQA39_LY17343 [Lamprigera yunnana]
MIDSSDPGILDVQTDSRVKRCRKSGGDPREGSCRVVKQEKKDGPNDDDKRKEQTQCTIVEDKAIEKKIKNKRNRSGKNEIKIGTENVKSGTEKEELVKELIQQNIEILEITETKNKGNGLKETHWSGLIPSVSQLQIPEPPHSGLPKIPQQINQDNLLYNKTTTHQCVLGIAQVNITISSQKKKERGERDIGRRAREERQIEEERERESDRKESERGEREEGKRRESDRKESERGKREEEKRR